MSRNPYRVEINYPKNRKPQYFLVKDVWFGGKKSKVKKYLCSGDPPSQETVELYRMFAFDLELKAAKKVGKLSVDQYKIRYLNRELANVLEEIRYLHKIFTKLLSKNEAEVYESNFEYHYVQGTTSIEGNTCSLDETKNLLEHGIIPKTKTLREINEIQNFKNVRKYRENYKGKVSIDFIKSLHALIMQNIDHESAGYFRRTDDIGIIGCDALLSPSSEIENELNHIISFYYNQIKEGSHPFEEAIMFHYFFEMIHPFADGNGRVGREILNFMLPKNKYPRVLFLGEERENYLDALKHGNQENYSLMVDYFVRIIINQRMNVLKENVEKLLKSRPKTGQSRLSDYFSV
ncbi:MAG: Fic family protein [Methanogenium sp.]|nr:Fic family protein [Methanogenium sp.]